MSIGKLTSESERLTLTAMVRRESLCDEQRRFESSFKAEASTLKIRYLTEEEAIGY